MTKKQDRVSYAVDGDQEVVDAAARYRQLRAWREGAQVEMDQISEKLKIRMNEHGAEELTVDGVVIARLSRFSRYTVTRVKAFADAHPRIFKTWGKVSPVERVDVP